MSWYICVYLCQREGDRKACLLQYTWTYFHILKATSIITPPGYLYAKVASLISAGLHCQILTLKQNEILRLQHKKYTNSTFILIGSWEARTSTTNAVPFVAFWMHGILLGGFHGSSSAQGLLF